MIFDSSLSFTVHTLNVLDSNILSQFSKDSPKVRVFACQDSFKQFAIISIASSQPPTISNKVTHICCSSHMQSETYRLYR